MDSDGRPPSSASSSAITSSAGSSAAAPGASSSRSRTAVTAAMFATPQIDPPATAAFLPNGAPNGSTDSYSNAESSGDGTRSSLAKDRKGKGEGTVNGLSYTADQDGGEEEEFVGGTIGRGQATRGSRTSGGAQWKRPPRSSGSGSHWMPGVGSRHAKKGSDMLSMSTNWSDGGRGHRMSDRLSMGWKDSTGLPLPPSVANFPARRQRYLAFGGAAFLFLLFYRWVANSGRSSSASVTLQRLTLNPVGLDPGGVKARALMSRTNPYGFISLIDPYAGGVFNPSLIALPDNVYLGARILMVARGPERVEVLGGEDVRWQTVFGLFVIPMERKHLKLPYLARESDLIALKLPAKRKMPFRRCENKDMDQFIGAEDPRLFLTNDGQPLLIYSQTGHSPMICRAINVIDARVVMPGLKEEMDRAGWSPPIVFTEQTDLIRSEQFNIEKNWAPFLGDGDELWFHISLVPQLVYRYVANFTLRPLDPNPPSQNCLTDLIGADAFRVKFHHATPLLRVTMCKRGECIPDIGNTLLFGIIHIKYHPEPYLFYERRVVTWNITSPYEYLSVSKPLSYMGTNQADPIFTVSMAWNHPTPRKGLGLNHGFLGESLLISFGVYDYGSAYLEVLADDLLAEHSLCAPSYALWGRPM